MKSGFSTIFVIALSILGFMVGFKACGEHKGRESAMKQVDDLKAQLVEKDRLIKHYIDEDSNKHIRIKQLELDREVLQRVTLETQRLLKLKPKQIKSKTEATTSIDTTLKLHDTVYIDEFIYVKVKGDSIRIALNDTIHITEYWKRKWFLGAKHTYVDLSNRNPYVKIDNITAYRIKTKRPLFVIGPYVGYDVITNNFSAGVCILLYPLALKIY